MAKASKYAYSPLDSDHIRLLMIEIGPETSTLRCSIEHFKFSEAPPYRALSYEWGSPIFKTIRLNGLPVNVRKNLLNALWHLRLTGFTVPSLDGNHAFKKSDTRWIWIDALSIDQGNTRERNHQVRSMGRIYKEAVGVFAWLGCRDDGQFGSTVYVAVQELAILARADPKASDYFLDKFGLSKFHELVYQPYWKRMWIMQEITLAQQITILFDDISAEWKGLERLQGILNGRSPVLYASEAFRLDRHRRNEIRSTLEDLVETGRTFDCLDPRDKIYAILGLAVDCQDDQIKIDYSKSLFEVFSDTVRFYASSQHKSNKNGSLLHFSQLLQESFNRPTEIAEGAKAHHSIAPYYFQCPPMKESGFSVGLISKIGSIVSLNGLRESRSSIPPHLYWRIAQISISLREMAQAIPIYSKQSFATHGESPCPRI